MKSDESEQIGNRLDLLHQTREMGDSVVVFGNTTVSVFVIVGIARRFMRT